MAGLRRKAIILSPSDGEYGASNASSSRRSVAKKQRTLSELFKPATGPISPLQTQREPKQQSCKPVSELAEAKGKRKQVAVEAPTSDEDDIIELSDAVDAASEGVMPPISSSPRVSSKLPPRPQKRTRLAAEPENDASLWCDRFRPGHPSELAVQPKKVQQVRGWLQEALYGSLALRKYRKLLVLSGPAGSGKTAVIKALASTHEVEKQDDQPKKAKAKADGKVEEPINGVGYEILEWSTADNREVSDGSAVFRFRTWLARATAGPRLAFTSISDTLDDTEAFRPLSALSSGSVLPSLLLVEDLPNVSHPDTRDSFISAIGAYLSSSTASTPPLVLIVSDTTVRPGEDGFANALSLITASSSEDRTFTAFSLFPRPILQHPKASQIRFNPIATTLLKKLLARVADTEWDGKRKGKAKPSAKEIEEVIAGAGGDLRSALNGLQFLTLHGKAANVPSKDRKKASSAKIKPDFTSAPVARRETSLVIFHSLGKILYNKRWGQDPEEDRKDKRYRPAPPDKLPRHLRQFDKLQLKTDVDALFSDTTVSTDVLMAYLHHNYPQFCEEVEEAGSAMEYFSQADALMAFEASRWSAKPLTALYSFHVASRGMLMSLPSPVPKKGQKLFKPETWSVRERQEATVAAVEEFRSMARSNPVVSTALKIPRTLVATELMPFLGLIARHQTSYRHPTLDLLTFFTASHASVETLEEEDDGAVEEEEEASAAETADKTMVAIEDRPAEGEGDADLWFEGDDDIV